MDLILLQNAKEIELSQQMLGSSFDNMKKIAWNPFAIEDLRNNNIYYTIPSDHINGKYQHSKLNSQFKQFKDWCDIVDEHVSNAIPDVKAMRIRPFVNKLLALRLSFFLYFSEIEKLNSLLQGIKVNNVYYFHYPESQLSLLSKVLNAAQESYKWKGKFVRLEPKWGHRSLFPDNGLVPDWFDRNKKWKKIAKFIIRNPAYKNIRSLIAGLTELNVFKNDKPNILVFNYHSDVINTLNAFKQKVPCNFIFWEDIYIKASSYMKIPTEEIINHLKGDPKVHQWTTIHGIDLFDIFLHEIKNILYNDIPMFVATVKKFKELYHKFNFKMVMVGHPISQFMAVHDQCEDMNIPVGLFLHGGTIGLLEGYPDLGICFSGRNKLSTTYYFIYSKGLMVFYEAMKKLFPSFTAQPLAVGSNYFERLIQKNSTKIYELGDHIEICYVCAGTGIYNGTYKEGVYDDVGLYELRYNVVDTLKNSSNVTLYYKFGYNTEKYGLDLEKRIISGAWKNVKAVPSKKRLVELLDVADVFIIEFPSTTLIEVLTTSKPVIALIDPKGVAITKEAEEMLRNRITIVRSAKELIASIEDIKENGKEAKAIISPDHNDKTFINSFATCGNFNSIERTVGFMKSIVNE